MYWMQRRQWHPSPVLLPGKSHGWRSLVGCGPWGHKESDMTRWLHFHFSLSCFGEGNGNPLHCSCLENPRDGGAWWAAVYRVTQSQTWLKRLSSSSMYKMKNLTPKAPAQIPGPCSLFPCLSSFPTSVWKYGKTQSGDLDKGDHFTPKGQSDQGVRNSEVGAPSLSYCNGLWCTGHTGAPIKGDSAASHWTYLLLDWLSFQQQVHSHTQTTCSSMPSRLVLSAHLLSLSSLLQEGLLFASPWRSFLLSASPTYFCSRGHSYTDTDTELQSLKTVDPKTPSQRVILFCFRASRNSDIQEPLWVLPQLHLVLFAAPRRRPKAWGWPLQSHSHHGPRLALRLRSPAALRFQLHCTLKGPPCHSSAQLTEHWVPRNPETSATVLPCPVPGLYWRRHRRGVLEAQPVKRVNPPSSKLPGPSSKPTPTSVGVKRQISKARACPSAGRKFPQTGDWDHIHF